MGEKAPAAVEGAPADQGVAAARAGDALPARPPAAVDPGWRVRHGAQRRVRLTEHVRRGRRGARQAVAVSGVWMGQTEVSNAQWAAFAEATGYKSESARFAGRPNPNPSPLPIYP